MFLLKKKIQFDNQAQYAIREATSDDYYLCQNKKDLLPRHYIIKNIFTELYINLQASLVPIQLKNTISLKKIAIKIDFVRSHAFIVPYYSSSQVTIVVSHWHLCKSIIKSRFFSSLSLQK